MNLSVNIKKSPIIFVTVAILSGSSNQTKNYIFLYNCHIHSTSFLDLAAFVPTDDKVKPQQSLSAGWRRRRNKPGRWREEGDWHFGGSWPRKAVSISSSPASQLRSSLHRINQALGPDLSTRCPCQLSQKKIRSRQYQGSQTCQISKTQSHAVHLECYECPAEVWT